MLFSLLVVFLQILLFANLLQTSNQIIVLNQKINDKYIIISDCGEILLKNIPILNANQIIMTKNGVIIYDNNSNLIKINYN